MPFMIPEYTREDFYSAENIHGETVVAPKEAYGWPEHFMWELGHRESSREEAPLKTIKGRWWARLSAPGHMDCTDWLGPFETLEEAKNEIREYYEVDPDTGADLDDHEHTSDCGEECDTSANHENSIPKEYNEP